MVHEMGLEQRNLAFLHLPYPGPPGAAASVLSSGFLEKAGLEK